MSSHPFLMCIYFALTRLPDKVLKRKSNSGRQEVVTLSEKFKRVLNISPQNEYCIDALLFFLKNFPYSLHWREKTIMSILTTLERERKNIQINVLISNINLVLQYTVQLVISDISLTKISTIITLEKERERRKIIIKKKAKRFSPPWFC